MNDPASVAMYYYIYVIMHVKEPELSIVGVGHYAPLAGFCLSLYSPDELKRDVDMIQTNKKSLHVQVACIVSSSVRIL